MRNKKNVALALTLTIAMAASFVGCSSDKTNESVSSTNASTQTIETNVSMDQDLDNQDSFSMDLENTEFSDEGTENENGTMYEAQGVIVHNDSEPGLTDTTYYEILRIEKIDDGTTWSYVSEENEIGQYSVLNYAICGNSILITEKSTLHVYDLTTESEIATASLNSFYNGAVASDSQYAYFMNADGGEVLKADSAGELIWEIDNCDSNHADCDLGGGGFIEITDDGNLNCNYEFGNYSLIVISQEDGSFVEKME